MVTSCTNQAHGHKLLLCESLAEWAPRVYHSTGAGWEPSAAECIFQCCGCDVDGALNSLTSSRCFVHDSAHQLASKPYRLRWQCLPCSPPGPVQYLWVQVSPDCSNFDEAEAWPLLLDNYAEWVQKKEGNGGSQTAL